MSKYGTYRDQCEVLQEELTRLKATCTSDIHDATIEYLLRSSETLLTAVSTLIGFRTDSSKSGSDKSMTQ